MTRIFISYRRSDSIGHTGRIHDRLVTEFGQNSVFMDVDDIPIGVDFAEHIAQEISQCQVVLVIIGTDWVTVASADGSRRLDAPDDFVRIEIESALEHGIPVVPVLLDGASMPHRSDLPESLHPLAERNGTAVGCDPRFHNDMARLIDGLKALVGSNVNDRISRRCAITILGFAGGGIGAIMLGKAFLDPKEDLDSQEDWKLPNVKPEKVEGMTLTFNVATTNVLDKTIEIERKQAKFHLAELDGGLTLDLMLIPGGSFDMGELSRGRKYEHPQHKVSVAPFWIGRCQVTQAQWRLVSAWSKVERNLSPDPSKFKGNNHPVEQISWQDASEFCQRLSKETGQEYRLPSEAEWEYACRAGTTTPFHCGETITTELANYEGTDQTINDIFYSGSYGDGPKGKYREETTEVGSFPSNAFGLNDMHGNVHEWCLDHWHENYIGAPRDGTAWLHSTQSSARVVRGGSLDTDPASCRSASRNPINHEEKAFNIGFRVICSTSKT